MDEHSYIQIQEEHKYMRTQEDLNLEIVKVESEAIFVDGINEEFVEEIGEFKAEDQDQFVDPFDNPSIFVESLNENGDPETLFLTKEIFEPLDENAHSQSQIVDNHNVDNINRYICDVSVFF